MREFEEKVAGSAIPQEVLGDINKEKLPGMAALKEKGIVSSIPVLLPSLPIPITSFVSSHSCCFLSLRSHFFQKRAFLKFVDVAYSQAKRTAK